MKPKIFIDGKEGTTGLKIYERLETREDIQILTLSEEKRKDTTYRKNMINKADYVFLCLPDIAAKEAVSLCENKDTVIIDASTAHRINSDFAYGFPELSDRHLQKIKDSKRIAVPGCYASAFISIIYPLVSGKIIPEDYPFTASAVSGYSGAGKTVIKEYEENLPKSYAAPRAYSLSSNHKHLPEMKEICGLKYTPIFTPLIDNYYAGILMTIPVYNRLLPCKTSALKIINFYKKHYENCPNIIINEKCEKFISANSKEGTNFIEITVSEQEEERIFLTAVLDNLGKGASGAAVQCLDIKMGL